MDERYGIDKVALFILNHTPEGEDMEVVSELNELLTKMGCGSVKIIEHKDSSGNEYYPSMAIHLNSKAAAVYNRRGAGRKKKFLSGEKWSYKVGDVKKLLENRTADDVAAELGISRSTLFRRLKDRDDDSCF